MSLTLSVSGLVRDALGDAPAPEPLNGDDVWYEYCTQHDSRVRPSHAALNGTVWRADDPAAPTPPIAYGCRCYLRYVAAPDSKMADVLPAAPALPVTIAEAFATHLDEVAPTWRVIAKQIAPLAPAQRAEAAFQALRIALPAALTIDIRDLANMIVVATGERRG